MKQLTHFVMPIQVCYDLDLVAKVEFIFKQYRTQEAPVLKSCERFPDGSGEGFRIDDFDTIGVVWTEEETMLFQPDEWFYMDTRIYLLGTPDTPETSLVALKMTPTLLKE